MIKLRESEIQKLQSQKAALEIELQDTKKDLFQANEKRKSMAAPVKIWNQKHSRIQQIFSAVDLMYLTVLCPRLCCNLV
jgi:chromosome segregation ATPase